MYESIISALKQQEGRSESEQRKILQSSQAKELDCLRQSAAREREALGLELGAAQLKANEMELKVTALEG